MVFDIQNWRLNVEAYTDLPTHSSGGGKVEHGNVFALTNKFKDSRLLDRTTASISLLVFYEMVNAMVGPDWENLSDDDRKQMQTDFLRT